MSTKEEAELWLDTMLRDVKKDNQLHTRQRFGLLRFLRREHKKLLTDTSLMARYDEVLKIHNDGLQSPGEDRYRVDNKLP